MRGINKVILLGNVSEVTTSADGRSVVKFNLVTTSPRPDKLGQLHEEQVWHRIECHGRLAEIVGQYVERGRALYLEGRLEARDTYDEAQEVFVVADTIQLLSQTGERRSTALKLEQEMSSIQSSINHGPVVAAKIEAEMWEDGIKENEEREALDRALDYDDGEVP